MGWSPSNTLLGTVNEQENIDFNISYINELTNEVEPVIITASVSDPTISLLPGRITGQYTDVFNNIIRYRTIYNVLVFTRRLNDIDRDEYYGIYYYQADPVGSKTYTYTAQSETSSQTYTVVIENDWSLALSTLSEYAAIEPPKAGTIIALPPPPTIIPGEVVVWTNSSGNPVPWINTLKQELDWKNSYGST